MRIIDMIIIYIIFCNRMLVIQTLAKKLPHNSHSSGTGKNCHIIHIVQALAKIAKV